MILSNGLGGMTAVSVLRQLDSNVKKSLKNAAEISSGKKINSAKDNASGYSISSDMQKQLRSLNQCSNNSQKGRNMLNTATGGIDQQIAIMRNLKKLALDSANDSNSPADRKIIQEHANQLFLESENIAQTTEYNGQFLLNKTEFSREDITFDYTTPYQAIPNSTPVLQQAATNGGSYTPDQGYYTTITTTPANTYDPTTVIQGTALTTLPAVGDVVWDNTNNTYGRVTLNTTDNALYVSSSAGGTLIEVNGTTNGSYATATSTNVSATAYPANTTAPAVGDTVAASATPSFDSSTPPNIAPITYTVTTTPGTNELSYFTPDSSTTILSLDFSNLFSTISNIPTDLNGLGFSFDCSGCNQYVTIMFDSSTDSSQLYGSTDSMSEEPICYKIGVQNVTDNQSLLETVFNGITSANTHNANAYLPSSTDSSAEIAGRHDIEINYYASTGEFTISKNGPSATFNNGIEGSLVTTDYYKPSQTLALQTGTTSSQYTNVYIPNTTLAALFPDYTDCWDNEPQERDYPNPWPNEYANLSDAAKKAKWRKEVWPYPTDNDQVLSTAFETQSGASKIIDTLDQSLKYLIHTSTVTGAESNRLNYTEDNLETSIINTTASASTITDTNIAKAMTEYTKNNLLGQAAQAMLAQANKNSNDILSLLQ